MAMANKAIAQYDTIPEGEEYGRGATYAIGPLPQAQEEKKVDIMDINYDNNNIELKPKLTLQEAKELQKEKIKQAKHPYNVYYEQKVLEYYERIEEVAKQKEEMAMEMKKPQYSDPTYFGHEKKPKKRTPGKKKYCTECGLSH